MTPSPQPDGYWIRCEIRGRLRAAQAVKQCYQRAGDEARAARAQRRIDDLLDRYNAAPLIAAFNASPPAQTTAAHTPGTAAERTDG